MSAPQSGDSDELEALFDSISATYHTPAIEGEARVVTDDTPAATTPPAEGDLHTRLGHMLRKLHDTLRELGYDKKIEQVVEAIPDAKDRLTYVANMTEQAAVRVLNATERAMPIQEKLGAQSQALAEGWNRLFARQLGVDEFKALVENTRRFLAEDVPGQTQVTNNQLMEIMMAQDFQDLTGQVIKKVMNITQTLENELIQVLLISSPPEKAKDFSGLLQGPVINTEGRTDIVTNQEQVDDLLASLGF